MIATQKYGNYLLSDFNKIYNLSGCMVKADVESLDGFKSFILEDPFCVFQKKSDNSFIVSSNPSDFSRNILRDYYFGYKRVAKQWDTAKDLLNKKRIAWCLISFYYAGFFSAFDSLRLRGKILINFSDEDLKVVKDKFSGLAPEKLESMKSCFGVFSEDFSEVSFTSAGEGPHKICWQKYYENFLNPLRDTVDVDIEAVKLINICRGQNGWVRPSDVRNTWNYRDPLFFDDSMEENSRLFRKIIDDPVEAKSWIRSKHVVNSLSDQIASLACIVQFAKNSLEKTYRFGFLNLEKK